MNTKMARAIGVMDMVRAIVSSKDGGALSHLLADAGAPQRDVSSAAMTAAIESAKASMKMGA